MDLNNITVDSLKEKFAAFDRKTLTKFGIGIGAIILFLIIYFMILKPMVDERKAKYADKTLKIQEIKQFENDIVSIKSQIKKIPENFKKKNNHSDFNCLIFSPNMGIAFSTPIIFLALILFFTKKMRINMNISDKLILILFFCSSAAPLLVWQGREVAYGQRLLIGIIPICILITSKYLLDNRLVLLTKFLTFFTYLGYLLFYSSEKLTLKPGLTLWGTKVGFTAENYYIELVKSLFNYETILSALLRNIYSVDIFKFINLRTLINDSFVTNYISIEKVEKFLSFTDIYFDLDTSYLVLVNISIISFCYLYTRLIFNLTK